MAIREDIEHYMIQMDYPFESIESNMWVIHDTANIDTANIVVTYDPPLILFRMKLMDIPKERREDFFKLLLELNASQMIHGAYGIEEENVVLIDTLQSEHLDFNEFQASLEALLLASTQDYQKLNAFRG
jgi:Tir chaperone protein (CesT) family